MASTHPSIKIPPERMYGVAAPSIREIKKRARNLAIRRALITAIRHVNSLRERPKLKLLGDHMGVTGAAALNRLCEHPDLLRRWERLREAYWP